MPESREQRLVFGEVAERYERARPGSPEQLVGVRAAIDRAGGTLDLTYESRLTMARAA